MKAYSSDLRQKIVAAFQRPGQRQHEMAAQYKVSLLVVAELMRHQRYGGG